MDEDRKRKLKDLAEGIEGEVVIREEIEIAKTFSILEDRYWKYHSDTDAELSYEKKVWPEMILLSNLAACKPFLLAMVDGKACVKGKACGLFLLASSSNTHTSSNDDQHKLILPSFLVFCYRHEKKESCLIKKNFSCLAGDDLLGYHASVDMHFRKTGVRTPL